MSRYHLRLRTFLAATTAAAIILCAIVAVPQWLSKQARLDVLRAHVGRVAELAATAVDGDMHRTLIEAPALDPQLYDRTLRQLVRFHSANSDIFYAYTMFDREGDTYFVLDTAASPDLRTPRKLRASQFMERFELREEYASDWLQRLARGETWINPNFQRDDYGNFLTAHAPIYDSRQRYSGFSGVDFDLDYYLAQEARFRAIGAWSLAAALLASLLIGYVAARYHYEVTYRIDTHYRSSMRDALTGLLNRRGALEAIATALHVPAVSHALLLVDIDDLKAINDSFGHAEGDALIAHVAAAISHGVREGDHCARLGGDEFMIFARDCDEEGASRIARRVLDLVGTGPIADAACSVSIGISLRTHAAAGFDAMYREADAALYAAKAQGKRAIVTFDPARPPRPGAARQSTTAARSVAIAHSRD